MRFALPRLAGASTVVLGSFLVVAPMLAGPPASGVSAGGGAASLGSPLPSAGSAALLPSAAATPVTPEVREVSVAAADRSREPTLAAKSVPQSVEGYGVVGATWLGRPPTGLRLAVRTQNRGGWSSWRELHIGHGPTAGSPETRQTRLGTDPLAVGEVDAVQLRATSATGTAPRDLELSVIDPGYSASDESAVGVATAIGATGGSAAQARPAHSGSTSKAASQAKVKAKGVHAPRPRIRKRAAWGADERMRSTSPRYGRVKAGFVHHTVNANRYSRSDVPSIIRGIYAYHTQSLGWSDIGYNFLIDRFGRKWVGRKGGPRQAVIGAHAYGYNHVSSGMAAIGNFETRQPSREVRRAFGRMLGWKLGLHGVRVGGRAPRLEGERFRAISGHRDADQTACPGIKLYRRLPAIRRIAIRWQHR